MPSSSPTEARPRGLAARAPLAAAVGSPRGAIALTVLGGVALAVQAFVNGRLAGSLGSVQVAAAVNNGIGLITLLAVNLALGSLRRGIARVRAQGGPPWWKYLGGALGAIFVTVSAAGAPEVGVALLTVAIVCGQTGGSLPVDAAGLSPAGKRPLTLPRVLGVAVAIVAVAVGALGGRGDLQLGILALAILAGATTSVQQAINGHVAQATGEPPLAGLVNFATGFAVLAAIALVVAGGTPPHGWSAPALDWSGGLLGAFYVVVSAAAVRRLGVLRLTLVVVAGQSAGALLVDLVAPAPGEAVTAATVIGVLLTVVAVAVSGRAPGGRRTA